MIPRRYRSLAAALLLVTTAKRGWSADAPAADAGRPARVVGTGQRSALPPNRALSDAELATALRTIARHQLQEGGPVRDGDYTPVFSVAAMDAARHPSGITWNYPWGVVLYGALRSTDVTGDGDVQAWTYDCNRALAQYIAWAERVHDTFGDTLEWINFTRKDRFAGGYFRLGNLDACGAMGAALLEGILRAPERADPRIEPVVHRIARWIVDEQARLPDGTFWRPEAQDMDRVWPVGMVWADDLYMSCPFLVRWAAYTHDGRHLTDAAHQIIGMATRLQDRDGVWFHSYSEPKQQNSGSKWGRANGWALVAAAEVLSALPAAHPDREQLLEIYRRFVAGLKSLQAPSGMWHQVLDRPEMWEETSCTAMFAYAIARGVHRGWLPASDMAVARRAVAAIVADHVTAGGVVKDICVGTMVSLKPEYYARRGHPDDVPHGRGAVLLALTEVLQP